MAKKRWKPESAELTYDPRKISACKYIILGERNGITFTFVVDSQTFVANHDSWQYPIAAPSRAELEKRIRQKHTPVALLQPLVGKTVMFSTGSWRDTKWMVGKVTAVREGEKRYGTQKIEVLAKSRGVEYICEPNEVYEGNWPTANLLNRYSRQRAKADEAYDKIKDVLRPFAAKRINKILLDLDKGAIERHMRRMGLKADARLPGTPP